MIDLSDCEEKEKVVKEFFCWLLDKDNVELDSEVDLLLAHNYYDPNIYYPKEIKKFFETKAMKRLGKVNQLGLVLYENSNCYHSRLEHSKGTYNRKLEELIYLYNNAEYRKYIEENNLKVYLIAELIKEGGHDIGHLPLSHIMEVEVIGKRGIHEEIGKKILNEDIEIQSILEQIDKQLPQALKESLEGDVLGFRLHDESNYDVDRLDYLNRDTLYVGDDESFLQQEKYEILYAKTDCQGNILKNPDGSIIIANENDKKKKRIDVYNNSALQSIENFLEYRVQAYKNIYFLENNQIHDSSVGIFLNQLLKSKTNDASNLKEFIESIRNNTIENIDIEEYIQWDDFKFFENCIEVARDCEDENLRQLASLIIPPINPLMNLTFYSMDIKNKEKNGYSLDEKRFLKELKKLIKGNNQLSNDLKNDNFFYSNCEWTDDADQIEKLKSKYGDLIEISNATVYGYKEKYPIYVKDKSGSVFLLQDHPQRICDWKDRKESMQVAFVLIPKLKMAGKTDEDIAKIRDDFKGVEQIKDDKNEQKQSSLRGKFIENSLEKYFDFEAEVS